MTTATQAVQATPQAPTTGSLTMITTLGVISLVSGLLLAIVYQSTLNPIARNNEERTKAAVLELLDGAVSQKIFTLSTPGSNGETIKQNIYAGYDDSGTLVGVALEAVDN